MTLQKRILRLAAAAISVALLAPSTFGQVKDWRKLKYPKLPEFKIDEPVVFTLGNGLTVYLMEDRELPLISATARVYTGAYYEPEEKVGLASLTGQVMRTGGTESMSGDEIDDFLNRKAAFIETSIGDDAGFASMNCLKEDFDEVFKVFVEILRSPAFAEEKLDVAKVQTNAGIARRNDNVGGITSREITRLVYGPDSPVARNVEYATVSAVIVDDLKDWHGRFYHPNNILLGLVGDFDAGEMKKKIEAAFGDWAKGPEFRLKEPEYRKAPNPGVFFVEKTDVTQANIAMAYLGIRTADPDYFSVQVMNEVFGGGFAARLFSRIRSQKGLAYSVGGGLGSNFVVPGTFRVGMQTKSASVGEAVDALYEEIRNMVSEPPTDAEIARAKSAILESFVFNYDSKGEILSQQMTYAYYGLPADFLEQFRSNIEDVGREDVIRVAKKYLDPSKVSLLLVGNPADFGRSLEEFGEVTTLDITIPPPPDETPAIVKTAESLATGREVLKKMALAMGGPNRSEVTAIRTTASVNVSFQGQRMTMGQNVLLVFPDSVRQTVQTPMGEQTVVLSGGEAFALVGGAVRSLPASVAQKELQDMGRDLRVLVRYADDPEVEAVAAGKEPVEGVACDVVQVTYRGASSRIWVDSQGRVLKQVYAGENPLTRAPGSVEVRYRDYRDLEGLQVPHEQSLSVDGEEVTTLTLESFEVNPEYDPALLEKPAA
jgi:predicted Zn-dependent peptidase